MGFVCVFFASIIFFLMNVSSTFAAVRINEIYPAAASGESEWVELYNDGDQAIDISGYVVTDLIGTKLSLQNSSLGPFGYGLATSNNVLNNSGPETVNVKDNNNNLIDSVRYLGTFTSEKTYVRCPDGKGDWFILGLKTKQDSNYQACLALSPTSIQPTNTTSPPTQTQSTSVPTIPTTYSNIYLSEAYVFPQGDDHEWIELYNGNDYALTLTDWYIDDVDGSGASPRIFTLSLSPKSYGVFDLGSSVFNNDGDTVRLLDAQKNQKDSFSYSGGQADYSIGRVAVEGGSVCLQKPTRGGQNSSCISPTTAVTTSKSTTSPTTQSSSPTTGLIAQKLTPSKTAPSPLVTSIVDITNEISQSAQKETHPIVLGASDNQDKTKQATPLKAGFLASAVFSLVAIGYSMRKIIKKSGGDIISKFIVKS